MPILVRVRNGYCTNKARALHDVRIRSNGVSQSTRYLVLRKSINSVETCMMSMHDRVGASAQKLIVRKKR